MIYHLRYVTYTPWWLTPPCKGMFSQVVELMHTSELETYASGSLEGG